MSDVKKQDGDGMKSKESGGKKSIGCPAENKVIKSPVKKEAADAKSSEELISIPYCPCNDYLEEELLIECESCHKYWHLFCVGLLGLTEDIVSSLENWECPDCYKCIYSYKKKTEVSADCNSMRVILKDELHLIQPVIRVTVISHIYIISYYYSFPSLVARGEFSRRDGNLFQRTALTWQLYCYYY